MILWVNFEKIMLTYANHRKTNIAFFPFMCGSYNSHRSREYNGGCQGLGGIIGEWLIDRYKISLIQDE